MNEREPLNGILWPLEHITLCGSFVHVITVDRVQQFAEDNYDRRLSDKELRDVSILLSESGDEVFLDAVVRRVISRNGDQRIRNH